MVAQVQNNILIVDDDPDMCDLVESCLEDTEFHSSRLYSGLGVADHIYEAKPSLAVIDLNLPDVDGLTLTRQLKEKFDIGVIILTGRTEPTERVIGLEIGADDYVGKPFEPRELLARIRSVLRRITPKSDQDKDAEKNEPAAIDLVSGYKFDSWTIDTLSRRLLDQNNSEIKLTSGEYSLLLAFVEHANRVLTRDQLIEFTHTNDSPAFDRSIDVQVGRLRKKVEVDPKNPMLIQTIRNAGYMFTTRISRL